jgi:hypothetical protein
MSKQAPKLRGTIYGQKALDLKSQGLSLAQIKAELLAEGLEISPAALSKFFNSEAEKDTEAEAENEPLEFDQAEAENWIYSRINSLLDFICKIRHTQYTPEILGLIANCELDIFGFVDRTGLEQIQDIFEVEFEDKAEALEYITDSLYIKKVLNISSKAISLTKFALPTVKNIAQIEYVADIQTRQYLRGERPNLPADKIEFCQKSLEKLCSTIKNF